MPVYLARASLPEEREIAVAADVAAHGLCVITSRYWRPGELLQVTRLSDEARITAKVAYCWRQLEHTYHTGLVLERPVPRWWQEFRAKVQA